MTQLANNCDLLVHECTISPTSLDNTSIHTATADAVSKGHSTAIMAAVFAKKIKAKTLILNHFSIRYLPNDTNTIVAMAKRYSGNTDVIAANDFMLYNIKKQQKN